MAAELRAVPELLFQAGSVLADHGQSLLAVQQSCHRDADASRSGWIGSSAGALSGLLDHWAAASTNHIRRLGEHSSALHVGAAEFAGLDVANAASLR